MVNAGTAVGLALALAALGGCGHHASRDAAEREANAALLRRDSAGAVRALAGVEGAEADRLRATAALQQGDLAHAEALLDHAACHGGSGAVWADYARVRLVRGDLAGAARLIDRARALDPFALTTLVTEGEIALRQGRRADALAAYREAARRYPGNAAALDGLKQAGGGL